MKDKDNGSDQTAFLPAEEGEPREVPAGPAEQQAELPLGPMREGIVSLHAADEEDETVKADRREAERRGEHMLE